MQTKIAVFFVVLFSIWSRLLLCLCGDVCVSIALRLNNCTELLCAHTRTHFVTHRHNLTCAKRPKKRSLRKFDPSEPAQLIVVHVLLFRCFAIKSALIIYANVSDLTVFFFVSVLCRGLVVARVNESYVLCRCVYV